MTDNKDILGDLTYMMLFQDHKIFDELDSVKKGKETGIYLSWEASEVISCGHYIASLNVNNEKAYSFIHHNSLEECTIYLNELADIFNDWVRWSGGKTQDVNFS